MKIGICGISGRMGSAILTVVLDRNHNLACAFDAPDSPHLGKDAGIYGGHEDLGVAISAPGKISGDVLIDFSSVKATLNVLSQAVESKIPLVIGTTGFDSKEKDEIEKASKEIPILFSPNYSLGVNLLFKLTEITTQALEGSNFDVEVFEAHHRNKVDSPSGTAKKLVEIIKNSSAALEAAKEITGRDGIVGKRTDDEIGIFAMRGGDIVGEHTVFYAGVDERIELTHRASNRTAFGRGAVVGAEFIAQKKSGLYTMFDVLGF
jgi:4-hydroxy-tetrahydrodipicolinate reductase